MARIGCAGTRTVLLPGLSTTYTFGPRLRGPFLAQTAPPFMGRLRKALCV